MSALVTCRLANLAHLHNITQKTVSSRKMQQNIPQHLRFRVLGRIQFLARQTTSESNDYEPPICLDTAPSAAKIAQIEKKCSAAQALTAFGFVISRQGMIRGPARRRSRGSTGH